MRSLWIELILVAAVSLVGCGGGETKTDGAAAAPTGPVVTPDEANGATINGKVAFFGDKPSAAIIDMSAVPACANAHKTPVKSEVAIVNDNGTLKNAFVWVKSGLPAHTNWEVPSTSVMVTQVGCMYQPHVIGIMTGQTLAIRNEDPTNHNIHPSPKVNAEWNETQPPGSSDHVQKFKKEEVLLPIKCNIHPWMQAYIGVVSHPFFAVTGSDGAFTFKGLPPGTYTIEMVHVKFGTLEKQITVTAKESVTLDFLVKS